MDYDRRRFKNSAAYVEYLQLLAQDCLSLNELITSEDGSCDVEIGDLIADKSPTPEEMTVQQNTREFLLSFVDRLSPRDAFIIRLRFGFDTGKSMSLEEIGNEFGVTRERVRQVEGRAMKRLRHMLKRENIHKGDIL